MFQHNTTYKVMLFVKCCLMEYALNSYRNRIFLLLNTICLCISIYWGVMAFFTRCFTSNKQFLGIKFWMILTEMHHIYSTQILSVSKFYIINTMFRKLVLLPSSHKGDWNQSDCYMNEPIWIDTVQHSSAFCSLLVVFRLGSYFDFEDEGSTFLRNVSELLAVYMVSHSRM
jgi:hypothetical protein